MAELREDFDLISGCVKNAQFFLLLNVSTDYNELKSIISRLIFLRITGLFLPSWTGRTIMQMC